MANVAEQLGSKLYMACISNNVAQVRVLIFRNSSTNWSGAAIAAASEGAADVVSYCFRDPGTRNSINDSVLRWVIAYDALDAAYRFLDESGLVDANHVMEWTGTVLGVLAGESQNKRHGEFTHGNEPVASLMRHAELR